MKLLFAKYISSILVAYFKIRYGKRIQWGRGVILNHKFRFAGPGRLIIGDHVNLWAHAESNQFLTFAHTATIIIGAKSRLNGVIIQCSNSVTINQECLLGSAMLIDNDFHSVYFSKRNDPTAIKSAPIIIEERVWLAGQSAILKGVTVGRESVVGFRAVVTKDVPTRKIVAGNPAQIVRDIE